MPVTPTRLLIAVGLITLSVLPAAAQSDAGKTLRMVPHADLAIVDPYFSGVYITRNFGYLVYDTLFGMDRLFHPQPEMVDSWQASPDGLSYTFRLRDGLKFHDGRPVRAADAVASLKRWGQRNDAYGQALLAAATAIDAADDRTFRILLKRRFPVLEALATTTTPTPFIMPERLAQTDAYTQLSEVVGSGPFKFVKDEWQPGHKAVYARNPAYAARAEPPNNTAGGKVAKVDRIEWLYIPEAATAVQALETGEIDYVENAPNDYAAALARDPEITVQGYPGFIGVVRFNQLHPPFDNVKMRQAVLAVADQRDYMSAMAGDQSNWRTCFSVYACDAEPDEDDGGILSGPRHWDRAKRLVAEAGYKGERIVIIDPADIAQLHAEALVTEQLLKKLGLNVELATSEWGTAIKRINVKDPVDQGGWSVFGTAYASYDLLNPATNRNLRTPGATGVLPGWASDETIEVLRKAWFAAGDEAQRRDLADQIQRRAFEIALYMPIGQYIARRAFRKSLAGISEIANPRAMEHREALAARFAIGDVSRSLKVARSADTCGP